jgi:hypothetical protein
MNLFSINGLAGCTIKLKNRELFGGTLLLCFMLARALSGDANLDGQHIPTVVLLQILFFIQNY